MKNRLLIGIIGAIILSLVGLSSPVWAVSVTLRVVDQHGVDIPASYVGLPYVGVIPAGTTVDIPEGVFDARIIPGINGTGSPDPTILSRSESVEVLASTRSIVFEWITSTVTFDVVDQTGQPIVGSELSIYAVSGLTTAPTPLTFTLPITDATVYPTLTGSNWWGDTRDGYSAFIVPGINGTGNFSILDRIERVKVLASTRRIDFEWITSTVTFNVVDQNGQPIEGSGVAIYPVSGLTTMPTPLTLTLPITDETLYPTMSGSNWWGDTRDGYSAFIVPGINGTGNFSILDRIERVKVLASTRRIDFEWITSTVTFNVVDQNGQPIEGSGVAIYPVSGLTTMPTPLTLTLPITDETLYPTMSGSNWWGDTRDGYSAFIVPGINGVAGNASWLARNERVDVLASTTSVEFEWVSNQCPVAVVDSAGERVDGSTFTFTIWWGVEYSNADSLQLPITDNNVYPQLSGGFVDGYQIILRPGDTSSSGMFQFEALPGGIFSPQFVTIDGKSYGLRCNLNQPPVPEAGNNVAISSAAQLSTFIIGKASDPNAGDHLTYRWLEGDTELLAWSAVQTDGTCPLDLGALPPLSLGDHTLTLEVTDGQATARDRMNLEIDNSPPTISCAGSITVPVWSSFDLNGSVADYDGNQVSWVWMEGAATYGTGTAHPLAGGAWEALPLVPISSGLSLGQHTLTLAATEGITSPVACTLKVNVIDTKAPTMAPVATPSILWPPDHKMVDVKIETHALDDSRMPVMISVDQIASTANPDRDKNGNIIPDSAVLDIDQSTGTVYLQLRSERPGKGPARVYTVTIRATDASGNSTTADIKIQVPHDKGK